jgi:hypothetical protein
MSRTGAAVALAKIRGVLVRNKLVLVAGAVVFGTLALASPAFASGAAEASADSGLTASSDGSGALGSPGSIAVPTSVEA